MLTCFLIEWKLTRQLSPGQAPAAEGGEVSEGAVLAAMHVNKPLARELLTSALPVPDAVLAVHQKALADIASRARHKRLTVRPSNWIPSPQGWGS